MRNLEKAIYSLYLKSTKDYVCTEDEEEEKQKDANEGEKAPKLVAYKINENMKTVYKSFIEYLNSNLAKYFINYQDYEIDYIPFGSITQFLSGEGGDIDLFLDIKRRKVKDRIDNTKLDREKTQILKCLRKILTQLDKGITFHQTNRLCLFTITYQKVKIDINVYGICSYYGELLLREYSLIDIRFPMLVIYLKYIIKVKDIKNTEKEKFNINSFAWTNILLTFLQDILDPPLFPRLLNEENMKQITIKVGGGKGKEKKKELEDEFDCQRCRTFKVMNDEPLADRNQNQNNIRTKNKMALSQIMLKFIQFIGYFFNYDYSFVNTSYECQSFTPKAQVYKLKDQDTKKFFKKFESENALLIREPFDHTYNPCKTVDKENLKKITKIFREIYQNILEKGVI